MKNKNKSQRLLFFFDFSNSLKQMKIDLFALKTLLKTCIKTLVNERNFALEKFLLKNQLKWGIYNPFGNLPVGS